MGLLTDPSSGQGKLTKALVKYYVKICVLLYVAGAAWIALLAYPPLNNVTYFSENALLPGLVKSEFRDIGLALQYYDELKHEMEKYRDSIPYPWLLAKFRQVGLDVYTHNFTLNYPLGKPQRFTGKNVYAIMRAARAASTESLVLSMPFRPLSSVHPSTAPSIAIMLAFAKFANKEKYWSKDIIFLITEHEQLGAQAWLEAYHMTGCGEKGVLDYGDLRGRAGAIQAAINLELHNVHIDKFDVKVEGLNGQLPNLDLVNLAVRMCTKEGVGHTFKDRLNKNSRDPFADWTYSAQTMAAMMVTQATGIPNGNHGLFHRFGIQALTLTGSSMQQKDSQPNFTTVGRILEGIFRSLNNLLERFHQSYFFYILPSSDRFISIGLYMPSICLIAGALFIKACGKWCQLQQNPFALSDTETDEESEEDKETEVINETKSEHLQLIRIGAILFVTHTIGILVMGSAKHITLAGWQYGYTTEFSIYLGFGAISLTLLLTPVLLSIQSCHNSAVVLNIVSLLELGTTLICLSMYNFSLGLIIGVIYVPFVLLVNPSNCKMCSRVQGFLLFLIHPFLVLTFVVVLYTFYSFAGDTFYENIVRGFGAAQQALAYGVVDSMIYSNWLYNVVAGILLPNWLCFWCVMFSRPPPLKTEEVNEKKKND